MDFDFCIPKGNTFPSELHPTKELKKAQLSYAKPDTVGEATFASLGDQIIENTEYFLKILE